MARLSADLQKIELARDCDRALTQLFLARTRCPGAQHGRAEGLARLMLAVEHQVLDHGELRQPAGDLERARKADIREPVGAPAGDVRPVERDGAVVRLERAGDRIEQRGLAGAVRPDQSGDAAFLDGKVRAVERRHAAEAPPQAFDFEQCHKG